MPRTPREQAIINQDERNRRMKRLKPGKAKRLREKGVSAFSCRVCHHDWTMRWDQMHGQITCPQCQSSEVFVVTAMLNKGVLPRVR
jgi:transposase-like protein